MPAQPATPGPAPIRRPHNPNFLLEMQEAMRRKGKTAAEIRAALVKLGAR